MVEPSRGVLTRGLPSFIGNSKRQKARRMFGSRDRQPKNREVFWILSPRAAEQLAQSIVDAVVTGEKNREGQALI
jgi:hypothetical protein